MTTWTRTSPGRYVSGTGIAVERSREKGWHWYLPHPSGRFDVIAGHSNTLTNAKHTALISAGELRDFDHDTAIAEMET